MVGCDNLMKRKDGFGLLAVIIIIIITAIVSITATGVIMLNNSNGEVNLTNIDLNNDSELKEFIEVYQTLLSRYYDSNIDKKGMLNAAEEGMLNFLNDKYTTYLNDEEYKSIIDELSGTYKGIGVKLKGREIIEVTSSSPAEKAGLLSGDIITKVNDTDVSSINGTDSEIGVMIRNIIRDDKVKKINLEIDRAGLTLSFNISKEKLVDPSVDYKVLDDTTVGYIDIDIFSQNLGNQVSDALKELENKNITSLIIDVRDNVGGYLQSAEDVASMFIEEGKTIYSLETSTSTYSYKDKTKEKRNYKIVVLINENSASASEVLAAALKESYGATLVGMKSYGKGKVQQVVSLQSGDSVKYTSAKWLTPNGDCVDGIGIYPDHQVILERGEVYDSQVTKALEILK